MKYFSIVLTLQQFLNNLATKLEARTKNVIFFPLLPLLFITYSGKLN